MHLDEVKCVIGELIGYLVPLHGWRAGTVARPGSEEEQKKKMLSRQRQKKVEGTSNFFHAWVPTKTQVNKSLT